MIEHLGYGAASIGNLYREVSEDAARDALRTAWDGGVRYFDTAPHYGLGLSEQRLGGFLADKARNSFHVSTKVGRLLVPNPRPIGQDAEGFAVPDNLVRQWDPSRGGIEKSLEQSLKRMGLDRIDTVFLHDPDVYDLDAGIRIGLPALVQLREAGFMERIGVGVNSVAAAVRAVRETDIDVIMIAGRYTLLEQPAASTLLPEALERGVEVIAAAVFNSGLLAAADLSRAHYNYGDAPEEVVRRARKLARICADYDVPLPVAALQFPMRHPAVSTVVVGTSRADAMQQNIEYLQTPIPVQLWETLHTEGLIE